MKDYNYWAILVSAIASLIMGFVWFTLLFSAPYIHDLGKTQAQMDKGPSAVVASAIQLAGYIVMSFVLAWLINRLGYQTLQQGLQLGVLIWLGFVAAIIGPMYAFQAYSFRLFLIICYGYLISILLSVTILTLWKK